MVCTSHNGIPIFWLFEFLIKDDDIPIFLVKNLGFIVKSPLVYYAAETMKLIVRINDKWRYERVPLGIGNVT